MIWESRAREKSAKVVLGPAIVKATDDRGTGMTLRTEFEPLLLAPSGFCADVEDCAKNWERWGDCYDRLQDQIDRSKQWLQLCGTTKASTAGQPALISANSSPTKPRNGAR